MGYLLSSSFFYSMRNIIRNKNFYLMLFFDSCLIIGSLLLAYVLRFEGNIPAHEWEHFYSAAPYMLLLKLTSFWFFGLYKGMYRYISLVDLFNVLKATFTSSAIIILAILFLYRFEGFPRSVFIIDWTLTLIFIGGIRVGIRLFLFEKERGYFSFRQIFQLRTERVYSRPEKRLIIIGAGDAGEKILREIRDNPRLNYDVFGFLDDDPRKQSMKIHGVPVLGPVHKIQQLASQGGIDEILIAVPSASAKQMRGIIEICEKTGLNIRTTPGIGELINGKISFKTIREVSFEDLLGRDPVNLDVKTIGDYLKDKVLLVSGAGGSIGSELCRQITQFSPKNLILLDKTENSLFHLEMEFRQMFPQTFITPVLGDVQNRGFLDRLFAAHRPQAVIHSAAYKHVPIVELNPWEGVFNNIIGTRNIVEASHQYEAEQFIMISTDKAVRPSNVMGATKRIAEMITSS
ncbi:MAG: polysaccharide biosynthesis protein, partial [Deltaproteobacteria bacterium]|nr:polysaccharide biosynthesis protein [Deltaproteobacteria bacterium]